MDGQAAAHLKNLRISPRKVKIVVDLIRNKPADMAVSILNHTNKAAALPVLKLLKSAMANAENNHHMDADNLYVAKVFANPGPTYKRMRPRAQGRGAPILKRQSHVTIVLAEKE